MNKLKNISAFLLLFTAVFFISCDGDIEPFEGTIPDPNTPVTPVDPALLPTLITTNYSNVLTTSASSGGTITTDGGSPVIARGVVWSTSQNPTIANPKTVDGTGIGNYSSAIAGLSPNTTYYVRAYATNNSGTGYGNQINFTTTANPSNFPVITTTAITNITSAAAAGGGNITSDGGSAVTERGVAWSTIVGPTIAGSKTIDGTGTGSFTSAITGLAANTLYYVRAYATNANGTSYGEQLSFTTATGGVTPASAFMAGNFNGIAMSNMRPAWYGSFGNLEEVAVYLDSNENRYLLLQGNGLNGLQFNLKITQNQWAVGTYDLLDHNTFSATPNCNGHLIQNNLPGVFSHKIVSGTITITEFSLVTKKIKGTFSFQYYHTMLDDSPDQGPYQVTNGTFDHKLNDPYFN